MHTNNPKRLYNFVADTTYGDPRLSLGIARRFILAEDDRELDEMIALLSPTVHWNSLWGVVRGCESVRAVFGREQQAMTCVWGPLRQLSSTTFERHGQATFLESANEWRIPLLSRFVGRLRQKQVLEQLVMADGKIIFRSLALNDTMWL